MRAVLALAAVLVAATALPALSRAQGVEDRFATFLRSPPYQTMLGKALEGVPPEVLRRCPELTTGKLWAGVIKSVSFNADGVPTDGEWLNRLPMTGCGADTTVNIFARVSGEGKIALLISVPGSTHANPMLQRDTLAHVRLVAGQVVKECPEFIVSDSRFEGMGMPDGSVADPGEGKPGRPWRETWTAKGCGHTITVPIAYVPGQAGTRILPAGPVAER